MKALKKFFVAGLIACAAFIGGAALWTPTANSDTVRAEAAQTYETKDVFVMARITNVYVPNGNFNLTITLSEYDTTLAQGSYGFSKDLATMFNELGFFDKIKLGNKTLREYGCVGFWENKMDINVNEPKPVFNLHCHADPALWQEAYNNGEIAFSSPSCPVTIEEGALIPGFGYLTGESESIVYRASHTFVSKPRAGIDYDMETYVQTEVDSIVYTMGWDANYNNSYLGISFVGDDYLGDGEEVEIIDYNYDKFTSYLLVNGEKGKVESYGLYNLNEAGKGHYSFVIRVPETECVSVTIPKGSLFPTRVTQQFRDINGHNVFFYYQTKEDVTFYKSSTGEFVLLENMRENSIATLQEMRAAKVDAEYFSSDVAKMNTAVAQAIEILQTATDDLTILQTFEETKALLEGILPKTEAVNSAKTELDAYKANETYFNAEDAATRNNIIETAKTAVDSAESSESLATIVADAKTAVDAIVTKDDVIIEKSAELNSYKAEAGYFREAEEAQRVEVVANAIAAINAADTAEQMEAIVANAKLTIDGFTTNAEYTAAEEEFAANKAAALAVANSAKAEIKTWLYTQETLTTINTLYTQTKQAIEEATDKAVMDKAAADFAAQLATMLPEIAEKTEATEKKSDGCGSVMSASAACWVLGAIGFALVCKKKEN